MQVETVVVNGVIVNVGEEETATKFAKKAKAEAKPEEEKKDK